MTLITKSVLRYLTSGSLALAFCTRAATMSVSSSSNVHSVSLSSISFLDAQTAKLIDDKLMQSPGFTIDQLMELAGYSVACATHDYYTSITSTKNSPENQNRKIMVISGPGNNGGDGLVAARHLKHFGYNPTILYPKRSSGVLFDNLLQQCHDLDIPITDKFTSSSELNEAALVIDAIFGFSFQGPAREPFSQIIESFNTIQTPVLSVDIPSGWHVDQGDIHKTNFLPAALISLTLPKQSTISYRGTHYVGGRFISSSLQHELDLRLPDYGYGPNQIVKLSYPPNEHLNSSSDEIVAMYVTASTEEEAMKISSSLVSKSLAACVNIIPQIKSVYMWEGKLESSPEVLMMIKTKKSLTSQVTAEVKLQHSYTLPESIVVGITSDGSNPDYIDWVKSNTVDTAHR